MGDTKNTKTGAVKTLSWWKKHIKDEGTYPLISDIEYQLENAVKEEESQNGFSLDDLEMYKDMYNTKMQNAHRIEDHRLAYEESIRKGVIEHMIAVVRNKK